MAKKDLNNDLFSGGSISDGEKKSKKAKKSKISSKLKKGVSANTAKIIKSVVAVVIVVALLVTYVATGLVRKGFIHSTLQWTTYLTAVTIKSEDGKDKINVPVSTYNYYYALEYNNLKQRQEAANSGSDDSSSLLGLLGLLQEPIDADFTKPLSQQTTTDDNDETITWQDYVHNKVMDSIEETYTFYLAAVKDNDGAEPDITTTQKSQLESTLSQYKEAAEKYGYTLSGYLVAVMGKGVTEKVFRREAIRSYIADNYKSSISSETVEPEYTEEEFNKYKEENADELKTVNVRIFEAKDEKAAAAFKEALKEDASNFTELAVQYSDEGFNKSFYADETATTLTYATKAFFKNSSEYTIGNPDDAKKKDSKKTYAGLDWLFSADRKAGDINQFTNTVVYVLSPVAETDNNTINIRHILVSPKHDPQNATKATDAEWASALKEAEELLKQFNDGDKTAESFAALAGKKTDDPGSKETGGLYENVAPGYMVTPFNNWCFADGRKTGDTGIVRTNSGYHIMFFDGETETPVWKAFAESQMSEKDTISKAEQLEKDYTAKENWLGSRYFEIDTDIDR